MTTYRVDELEGPLLDAFVQKALTGKLPVFICCTVDGGDPFSSCPRYSTDPSMGGWVLELMEREQISVNSLLNGWEAAAAVDNWAGPLVGDWKTPAIKGRTAKEAVLRCYVASKFGEEVDLP